MNQAVEKNDLLPTRISCLILTLTDQKLLVPLTAVAEVINSETSPVAGDSDGPCYGWINWREQRIPLLSLEVMCGGNRPPLGETNRMAIFNAVGDATELGFYAVRLAAIPQPVQVTEQTVLAQTDGKQALRLMDAVVGDNQAWLPNLEMIEARVAAIPRS
ncbi:MAG: hypothetical protein VR73_00570 [Gammaproteobacteria bacterium BRH_c0]|nr:MAG: hypothetical protein VR73_00570 [Gammaproteobacteria bacterium BRH_c0]